MTAHSYSHGYPTHYDEDSGEWVYDDTLESCEDNPRDCPRCEKPPTTDGHDACIGKLDRVISACCGHGVEPPSFLFDERPVKHPLPPNRSGSTIRFEIVTADGPVHGYFTINAYEDGSPGELFVHFDRHGSTVSGLLDSWAITVSIALQYKVPLADICHKLSRVRFEPAGISTDENLHVVNSVVDLIVRRLLIWSGETNG